MQIACCPVSGNVAVSNSRGFVRVWRLRILSGAGAVPYMDFWPAGPWLVHVPFVCDRLQLTENWMMLANGERVAVLQLVERRPRRPRRGRRGTTAAAAAGAGAGEGDEDGDGDDGDEENLTTASMSASTTSGPDEEFDCEFFDRKLEMGHPIYTL